MYQYPQTYKVLDVNVSALNLTSAFEAVARMVQEKGKDYVCVAPVSTIVDARRGPLYCDVVNKAALVTPDGVPVAWLGRLKGHGEVRRTYGPDLMLKVCDEGRALGFRHFFYGATPEICDKLELSLKARFPNLIVCGKIAPGFMKTAETLASDMADIINRSKPDILWVGLGSPKQDFWMAKNRAVLDVPVMVGIGAAFDFHAGVKPQAPRWLQALALEWLFRLCCEPKRLGKRYLVGNTLFVFWVVQEKISRLFRR